MKNEFKKWYKLLEEKRENLFSELKKYSDEIINKKPAPDKWSVAEVILHLMTGEEASLKYLQKKTLDTSKAGKSGTTNSLKYFLLKIAFDLPFKFKAPKVTSPPKAVFATLQELETNWAAIRKQTISIGDRLDDKDFSKELWRHPIADRMNLIQMVKFFTIHFDRHREQIERTLIKVNN